MWLPLWMAVVIVLLLLCFLFLVLALVIAIAVAEVLSQSDEYVEEWDLLVSHVLEFASRLGYTREEVVELLPTAQLGAIAIKVLDFMFELIPQAALVLLIVWAWRSGHNARTLGRTGERVSPTLGIFGWLVPLACWVVPYLVVSDLWRSSDPAAPHGSGWRASRGSGAASPAATPPPSASPR